MFSPLGEHIWEHLKTHDDELPRGRIKIEPDLVTQVENLRGNSVTFSIFGVEFQLIWEEYLRLVSPQLETDNILVLPTELLIAKLSEQFVNAIQNTANSHSCALS